MNKAEIEKEIEEYNNNRSLYNKLLLQERKGQDEVDALIELGKIIREFEEDNKEIKLKARLSQRIDDEKEFRCSKCNDTLENTQLICWTCHCQEKDKVKEECEKEFKEKIEKFKRGINNCGNLKCIEYDNGEAFVTRWVGNEPYVNLINEMIEALLSSLDNGGMK